MSDEQEQLEMDYDGLEGMDIPEPDYEPAGEVSQEESQCTGGGCAI